MGVPGVTQVLHVRPDPRAVELTKRGKGSAGFGLAEMMVALTIIFVVAAISAPFLLSYARTSGISAGAQELRTALARAKQLAVTTRQNVCVQPVSGTNRYQFRPGGCGASAWIGAGTDGSGNFSLQNRVQLTGPANGPVFTPLGTASTIGTITVAGAGGSLTVSVSRGGRISTP